MCARDEKAFILLLKTGVVKQLQKEKMLTEAEANEAIRILADEYKAKEEKP